MFRERKNGKKMSNNNLIELKPVNAESTVEINSLNLKKSILILKAVQHKLRLQMLLYIAERQPITVTELYMHFRLEQSAASQHLAILRKAGIVNIHRDGKFIKYSLNMDRLQEINGFVDNLLQ
jgi:DNA-binding transcriptional ArsR family regulator